MRPIGLFTSPNACARLLVTFIVSCAWLLPDTTADTQQTRVPQPSCNGQKNFGEPSFEIANWDDAEVSQVALNLALEPGQKAISNCDAEESSDPPLERLRGCTFPRRG